MKDNHFNELLEQDRIDEIESYWLERMESDRFDLGDLLETSRMLARKREKARAGVLMGLLDDHLRDKQDWRPRLKVLREIGLHFPAARRPDEYREQLRQALLNVYPDRPSAREIFRSFHFEDAIACDQLAKAATEIEQWLRHDVGEIFYREGYGTGVVTEINLKLGVMRLDFAGKETTFQLGDQELIPLLPGHILREKQQDPEKFRERAMREPEEVLALLLQALGRPLTVGEIKQALAGGIGPAEWSRWWTAARKNPQVLVSGKGAQASYSWSDSTAAAEQTVRDEFAAADVRKRITIVRANLKRSPELEQYFRSVLTDNATEAFQSGHWNTALELVELFTRLPGGTGDSLPYTLADVVHKADPEALLGSLENPALKEKVLKELKASNPDTWTSLFSTLFLKEESSKTLSFMIDSIREVDADMARSLLERAAAGPTAYPAAFTWFTELVAEAPEDENLPKADQRFFLLVLKSIDSPEFPRFRTRLKKAIESGLLVNVFAGEVDPELGHKAIEAIEKSDFIEEYRRERWRNSIRARVPQTRQEVDWIFSTREAYDRKRIELDQLIRVELPTNRKAIGEAAAHGDLSENHEYKAARERQDYLINRVAMLQQDLQRVRVLEPAQVDCTQVRPGTRVVLAQSPEKRMTMTILGPWDSNPAEGIYSYQAPIGMALVGKLPGEKIQWNQEEWVVEKIEPWM